MTSASPVPMAYFGKLPSRADFVRSADPPALTQTLDRWLTQGIELMAVVSADASGRRFPFVVADTFEVGGPVQHVGVPLAFMARSPMVLTLLWHRLERAAEPALAATDATAALAELGQTQIEVEVTPRADAAAFNEFLDLQTIGGVETLLLQPVPASGRRALDKGLSLPLPSDPLCLPFVATFWVGCVARFLTRGDFEVALLLPAGHAERPPRLHVGFSGGSPASLRAALDPEAGSKVFVDLNQAEWIEPQVGRDDGAKRLSSYLEQSQLSLRPAFSTFGESFPGD